MIAFVTLIDPHFRTVSYVRSAFADFFYLNLPSTHKPRISSGNLQRRYLRPEQQPQLRLQAPVVVAPAELVGIALQVVLRDAVIRPDDVGLDALGPDDERGLVGAPPAQAAAAADVGVIELQRPAQLVEGTPIRPSCPGRAAAGSTPTPISPAAPGTATTPTRRACRWRPGRSL